MKMHTTSILIGLSLVIGIGIGYMGSLFTSQRVPVASPEVMPLYTQPDNDTYEYSFLAVGKSYLTNPSTFAGFEVCDPAFTTCTVYGINFDNLANYFESKEYLISFNDLGNCDVIDNTTYCEVTSDQNNLMIQPLFEETY